VITVLMVLDIYTFGKKMRKLQNDQRPQPVIRHCESEIQHKGFRDGTGQRRFALTAVYLRAEYRSAFFRNQRSPLSEYPSSPDTASVTSEAARTTKRSFAN
jgi:hypothetical protein